MTHFITLGIARALATLIVATRELDIQPAPPVPEPPAVPDASWMQGPEIIPPPVRSKSPREYGEAKRNRRKK